MDVQARQGQTGGGHERQDEDAGSDSLIHYYPPMKPLICTITMKKISACLQEMGFNVIVFPLLRSGDILMGTRNSLMKRDWISMRSRLTLALSTNIEPLVTIHHHFDVPMHLVTGTVPGETEGDFYLKAAPCLPLSEGKILADQ